MNAPLQPLLHSETVVLKAPTQVWSAATGEIGSSPIHGVYFSDTRLVSSQTVLVGDTTPENIATLPNGANSTTFVSLLRTIDDPSADPGVRLDHRRTVTITGVQESLHLRSRLRHEVPTTVLVSLVPDATGMDTVKAGLGSPSAPQILVAGQGVRWQQDAITATLVSEGATVEEADGLVTLRWDIAIPAEGSIELGWAITASDGSAVVRGVDGESEWAAASLVSGDERLSRWFARAMDDLDSLRLATTAEPDRVFLAAGAPWFFTLFGRDSLWAARFMLPLGTRLAGDTLRVLAGLQGTADVPATAEEPGKIMHELRRGTLEIPGENISLPPLYYGTVDATSLWICLLYDAWRWGLPEDEVAALIPHLERALDWMRDFGDADGDGLLEYVDKSGKGLANQGWKDSGDSVQWRDGSLAEGPIALCEVQAYAYEAAVHGAELLEHFGVGNPSERRDWAARLKERFHASFWIADVAGDYPAIALDAQKRPVDTVTSNLGHLLGTGLLDERQSALVARRLVSPELNSGYGLRTMSSDSAGYWPLSYHGGSVWTHDTAIAITGLAKAGFTEEAASLSAGLLTAAVGFDYRMPELHSGESASEASAPVPYPAACRPQAWSAASVVSVLASILDLRPDAQDGTLSVNPGTQAGALEIRGLRLGRVAVDIRTNQDGEVIASSGVPLVVG